MDSKQPTIINKQKNDKDNPLGLVTRQPCVISREREREQKKIKLTLMTLLNQQHKNDAFID